MKVFSSTPGEEKKRGEAERTRKRKKKITKTGRVAASASRSSGALRSA